MNAFSPSDAALEGFQVIHRHWRVVVGWAGFNLLAMVVMVTITVFVLLAATAVAGGISPELSGQVGGVVASLGYLATQAVIVTGLYRLMLRPHEPGFLHLRLGIDELRTIMIFVLLGVGAGLAITGAGSAAGALSSHSARGAVAATAAIMAVSIGVAVRLALASVIGFARGGLPFAAAWRMTRGQTWRLIGMGALVFCLVALIAITTWVGLFLLGGALTGFQDQGLSGPDSLALHPGRYLLQIVAEMVLAPIFLILIQAPLVAVYQALSAAPEGVA
jgi:hypothetical protein